VCSRRSIAGAPRFTCDQIAGLTLGLREILVPGWLWFAEADGDVPGAVYALPDMNRVFQGRERDHGVLLVFGVRERYRRRGVNLALGSASYLAMMAAGCRSASYTIVLDDTWPSRRTAEKLGARAARSYNIYRRDLS
jgi:hypothetical protein